MNIYEKIIEIRKQLTYQSETSCNTILASLKPLLDEYGIILEVDMDEPRVLSEIEKESSAYTVDSVPHKSEKMHYLVQVGVNLTFINAESPNEKIQKKIYLHTSLMHGIAMQNILDSATQNFLSKYFCIPLYNV